MNGESTKPTSGLRLLMALASVSFVFCGNAHAQSEQLSLPLYDARITLDRLTPTSLSESIFSMFTEWPHHSPYAVCCNWVENTWHVGVRS